MVAADGVHSRLRAAPFPQYPGATYAGYVCWRGVIPAEDAKHLPLDATLTETWGPGLRFGVILLGDGRVY